MLAKKSDIVQNSTTSPTTSGSSNVYPNDSSTIGVIKEIKKGNMAIVSCDEGTDVLMPFYQTAGVREGAACFIGVASNVPRILEVIDFGTSNTLLFDPLTTEDSFEVVQPSSTGDFENVTGGATSVEVGDGGKFFGMELGGLATRALEAILFYGANSKIICSKESMIVAASSVEILSHAHLVKASPPPEGADGLGVVSETVFDATMKEDGVECTEVLKEYKGDVDRGMKEDQFTIGALISGGEAKVKDAIFLMAIIDENVGDYEVSYTEATHTYIDRKIAVDGGGENALNSQFSGRARIQSDIDSRAILGTSMGKDIAITYLKIITISGNTYEFFAGEQITVRTDSRSLFLGDRSDFMAKETETCFQNNYSVTHYPVTENTVIKTEVFGKVIDEIKGKRKVTYHEEEEIKRINARVEFEVDPSSNIETLEFNVSPNKFSKNTISIDLFDVNEDLPGGDNPSHNFVMIKNDAVLFKYSKPDNNGTTGVMYNNGTKTCSNLMDTNSMSLTTDGSFRLDSKIMSVDTEQNVFQGSSYFSDIAINGLFHVSADDIVFQAENSFNIVADSVYIGSETSIYARYGTTFVASCDIDGLDSEGDPKQSSMLYMNDFFAYLGGEDVMAYGGETIYAFADKNAAFGAESAIFYGGQQ